MKLYIGMGAVVQDKYRISDIDKELLDKFAKENIHKDASYYDSTITYGTIAYHYFQINDKANFVIRDIIGSPEKMSIEVFNGFIDISDRISVRSKWIETFAEKFNNEI